MANGVPTLMDFDFGAVRERLKAENQMKFDSDFLVSIRNMASQSSPNLDWDGANLSFTPGVKPLSKEDLWNKYTEAARAYSPPLKVDVMRFENELWPMYSQMSTEKFKEQMGALQMMGIPDKKWDELYRKNPEYGAALRSSIQNETDPAVVEQMSRYIPQPEGKGLIESAVEDPLTYGATGLLAAGAGKALYDKLKDSKFKGAGMLRGMGQSLPLLGAGFAGPLAGMLGGTEYEQDIASALGAAGATGYYGTTGLSNIAKNRLAGGLIDTDDMTALRQRAKALGIDKVDDKSVADSRTKIDKQKLKSKIASKVQGQKYRTSADLLKTANIKTPASSSALSKAGLTKLRGGGALGMGVLSALQLFNLAKGLYDSEDRKPFESMVSPDMVNPYREVE